MSLCGFLTFLLDLLGVVLVGVASTIAEPCGVGCSEPCSDGCSASCGCDSDDGACTSSLGGGGGVFVPPDTI